MIRVLELFGGIGACTKALKLNGVDFKVVDYVEIDKYAVASYNAINGTNFEPQDITKWDKQMDVDLIMHGSPCQDFSVGGKGKGGDEGSGTRSSLMYETLRIVDSLKPKYVVWENVKNLLSKKHKHNFDKYIERMNELGYNSYYKVINAKDCQIPQGRERVITVSIRSDIDNGFNFPSNVPLVLGLEHFLDKGDKEPYLTSKQLTYILDGNDVALSKGRNINNRIVNPPIAKTISCRGAADQRADITNFIVDYPHGVFTVKQLKDFIAVGMDVKVRKLSPLDCWMLMGFEKTDYEKASKVNSRTQLYKQAGNSIVVNVLQNVFSELLDWK